MSHRGSQEAKKKIPPWTTVHWTYSARGFEIPLCYIPPLRSFLFKHGVGSYWAKIFPRGVTGWVGGKLGLKLWMRLKKNRQFSNAKIYQVSPFKNRSLTFSMESLLNMKQTCFEHSSGYDDGVLKYYYQPISKLYVSRT